MKLQFKKYLENLAMYGWMNPSGKMFYLTSNQDHIKFSEKNTGFKYPKSMGEMFNQGWMRITYMFKKIFVNNPIKTTTTKQKQELINLAIENDYDEIIYDNDNQDYILWTKIQERTLYHGTIIDNQDSIKKYGIQGGWHSPIGSFVSNFYDDQDYGEPNDDDQVVFATDKNNLTKAINAMTFHIAKKLNKNFHDVNQNDIRNHGLLVIIKDSDLKPYDYNDIKWARDHSPRGAEQGDYFDSSMQGDVYLRGSSLIRFIQKYSNKSNKTSP